MGGRGTIVGAALSWVRRAGSAARQAAPARRPAGALSDTEVEAHHRVLRRFVEVYCRDHHAPAGAPTCDDCAALLDYARGRLERCPYSPKPKCKECPTHCYGRDQRARVREVMRYSGMYFVKRGRLDWLVRYFLLERSARRPRAGAKPRS
jgi:hypothetical protein